MILQPPFPHILQRPAILSLFLLRDYVSSVTFMVAFLSFALVGFLATPLRRSVLSTLRRGECRGVSNLNFNLSVRMNPLAGAMETMR